MKKISIIIPMYNSEAFIRQTIQSVIQQTYSNLEVLVVDDGSTDEGVKICRELSLADNRIHVYSLEKRGVSAARNYGLSIANGEYIFFLDSDDMIYPSLLKELLCQMEEQEAVLGFCSYMRLDSKEMDALEEVPYEKERCDCQSAKGEAVQEWFHKTYKNDMSGIGGKMFRAEMLGSLRFDENLMNGEDTWFVYHFASQGAQTVFLPQKWYYYRKHSGSVTNSSAILFGEKYFESTKRIRDSEYQKKNLDFALEWEMYFIYQMEKKYLVLKEIGKKKEYRKVKEIARGERKHPLYSLISRKERSLFFSCFYCIPLFRLQRYLIYLCSKWKQRLCRLL
ncbi:MAG: glycosyltransferase family 2 protein [Lachnospiraceae bacterium]|jgi:glycosyltransferase involved in cell wall biosynthesis|nr:glycosyltransferase family 2 protein [Lachnospiraceae bacterium]